MRTKRPPIQSLSTINKRFKYKVPFVRGRQILDQMGREHLNVVKFMEAKYDQLNKSGIDYRICFDGITDYFVVCFAEQKDATLFALIKDAPAWIKKS